MRGAALFLALFCFACSDADMNPSPIPPPWHMWGTTQVGLMTGVALVSSDVQLPQFVRVDYKRPETWTFLFWVQLQGATADVPVAVNFDFNVILGVGRSSAIIEPFKRVQFPIAETTAANINAVHPFRFGTRVEVPLLDPADTVANLVEYFPAQDITIAGRATSTGSIGAGNELRFEMGAFVAPRSHVRPDWFEGDPSVQFLGAETGGK